MIIEDNKTELKLLLDVKGISYPFWLKAEGYMSTRSLNFHTWDKNNLRQNHKECPKSFLKTQIGELYKREPNNFLLYL